MTRRYELHDHAFLVLTRMLREKAGLSFDDSRREALTLCVSTRMGQLSMTDVDGYLELLESDAGAAERQALLDEVTVPETHFFRNPPQIRALRRHVLPELLRQAAQSRRLRVWSAGCSTGEEPYTVAMLIRELLPSTAGWDVEVTATDISARALARAAEARYAERSFVMTDPLDLARWFVLDTDRRGHTVRPEVRELVRFAPHNLISDPPIMASGECDLLLCRNVTIYFDRDTTRRLMQRLHDCLRPGGYLFLGHAETLWQINDDFELTPLGDAFVYRRPVPGEERRRVLPDRRTENEIAVLRVDRRRGSLPDRRGDAEQPATDALPQQRSIEAVTVSAPPLRRRAAAAAGGPRPVRSRPPVPPVAADPLLAVRDALSDGRYAEAYDLAEDVIAVEPLRADAHYLQGVALTDLDRPAEAATVLRRAVYLDPDGGLAHFLLAGALLRLGEPQAAARCYRAAASALIRRPVDAVAEELGGRTVTELAETALELARRAEGPASG